MNAHSCGHPGLVWGWELGMLGDEAGWRGGALTGGRAGWLRTEADLSQPPHLLHPRSGFLNPPVVGLWQPLPRATAMDKTWKGQAWSPLDHLPLQASGDGAKD